MQRLNRNLSAGIALLCITLLVPCWGSDLAKEKRWADQVIDQLFDGEVVWLTAGGVDFLGLYTRAAAEPKGGIIVLHGIGVHPDWPQVINPLRVGLAEEGWNTLSVQLPILINEAETAKYLPLFAEVPPRVEAAIRYLQTQNSRPIFIVAHSMGVSMAAHYLGGKPDSIISGLVAIGSSAGGKGSLDESAARFSRLRSPMLDIYGENDLVPVLTGVATRASVAAASENDDFTQIEVSGADHFFDGYEQQLLDAVSSWLEARR
jgi:pimeloyl-ACP methyl ester carboxylesterase